MVSLCCNELSTQEEVGTAGWISDPHCGEEINIEKVVRNRIVSEGFGKPRIDGTPSPSNSTLELRGRVAVASHTAPLGGR